MSDKEYEAMTGVDEALADLPTIEQVAENLRQSLRKRSPILSERYEVKNFKPNEVLREYCRISALAYSSIGDYNYASDGFCDVCPNHNRPENYRNNGLVIAFVREAVLEKLKREGFSINEAFDPATGELLPEHIEEERKNV